MLPSLRPREGVFPHGKVVMELPVCYTSGLGRDCLTCSTGAHRPSTLSLHLLDTVVGWRSGARRLARPSAERMIVGSSHDQGLGINVETVLEHLF